MLSLGNQLARETGWNGRIRKVVDATQWDDEDLRFSWEIGRAAQQGTEELVQRVEKHVGRRLRKRKDYDLVQTIGGVGKVLAATIVLETGGIQRFKGPGKYASYGRLVDARRHSNGKLKAYNNRKAGNRYLSWAFHEAAHHACIQQSAVRRFYQRKCAKTNRLVAIRAVAHKLARATYFMLRDEVPYDSERLFR